MLLSLKATLPRDLRYEILMVDDGSTDGTRDWLGSLRDDTVRVHLNPQNLGYAAANNAGAALARGEILGLLNNDLILRAGWLEPMLEVLLTRGLNAGIVGNVQLKADGTTIDHAGMELTHRGKLIHLTTLPADNRPASKVFAVTGACILLQRRDFEDSGGFDERFINGCEDIDLCLKIKLIRKGIYVANKSVICHHVSISRGVNPNQDTQNTQRLFLKWEKQLTRALRERWLVRLRENQSTLNDELLKQIPSELLAYPNLAAGLLAGKIIENIQSHDQTLES